MKRPINLKVILALLFLLLIVVLFVKRISTDSLEPIEIKTPEEKNQSSPVIKQVNLSDEAPEIKNKNGKWINTDIELTPEDLKGKVVLIEFWTFGCYNCTNTLPYLKQWYEKYKSDNFEMIGVHCPEFDNERNFENVSKSVEELGIKYPVLTDNDFSIWRSYDVHAWPTIFLIDKTGEIRYEKVGEGSYNKTEQMINELLAENYPGEKSN